MNEKIGFTGTQRGMSDPQQWVVGDLLLDLSGEGHHGDCIGADRDFHGILEGIGSFIIIGHPPDKPSKRAFCKFSQERKPKPYLARNKDIVWETRWLIATPGEATEQLRSGTWSTVRFARKLGRRITIILPDGTKIEENFQKSA